MSGYGGGNESVRSAEERVRRLIDGILMRKFPATSVMVIWQAALQVVETLKQPENLIDLEEFVKDHQPQRRIPRAWADH